MHARTASSPLALLTLAGFAVAVPAQQNPRLETKEVAGNIYVLTGNGGNIGVSIGKDGVLLVDDQYAPAFPQIRAAIGKLSKAAIRFVVNTHWHGDHTGGNELMSQAGAVIVAHDNVRRRMSVEQFMKAFNRKVPPSPAAALPVITFADEVTFHWNGDDIQVFHVAPAHTDGDVMVWFEKAGVLHMGDVFFNGIYPLVDLGSGGRVAGVLAAVDRTLAEVDPKTKLIPGHGPLGDFDALKRYRAMMAGVHDRVKALVEQGKTADEVVAAKPSAEWDEAWGQGFMKPDAFVRIVYESVVAEARDRREAAEPRK